jgi:hypothetical protein
MNAPSLHFNAFIWPAGYHESAWRMVDDDIRGVLALPYAAPLKSLSGSSRRCISAAPRKFVEGCWPGQAGVSR